MPCARIRTHQVFVVVTHNICARDPGQWRGRNPVAVAQWNVPSIGPGRGVPNPVVVAQRNPVAVGFAIIIIIRWRSLIDESCLDVRKNINRRLPENYIAPFQDPLLSD